jgi:hypothetical protein
MELPWPPVSQNQRNDAIRTDVLDEAFDFSMFELNEDAAGHSAYRVEDQV